MPQTVRTVAFQGEPGAYSHQAVREVFPQAEAIPFKTFEAVIEAVRAGNADIAMLPVENSTYGRVVSTSSAFTSTSSR
jgi:prephenate dehydratase